MNNDVLGAKLSRRKLLYSIHELEPYKKLNISKTNRSKSETNLNLVSTPATVKKMLPTYHTSND
jgi:hypothetical protein